MIVVAILAESRFQKMTVEDNDALAIATPIDWLKNLFQPMSNKTKTNRILNVRLGFFLRIVQVSGTC